MSINIYLNDKFSFAYFFLVFVMFIFGCSMSNSNRLENRNENLFTIDVESNIEKIHAISLSEVGVNIEYIPLQTLPFNLISNIKHIRITKSFVFISERDKLLQFTRNGKFIKQIGNKGRGPGEYSDILHFDVDEKTDLILIQDEFRLNRYNTAGNFLGSLKNPFGIVFIIYSPNYIAFYVANDEKSPENIVITDYKLRPVFKFKNHNPRPKTNTIFSNTPLYIFRNKLFFKEHFNDTVFCINDSLLNPHIIFKERELLLDKNFELQSTGNISDLIVQIEKVKDKMMMYNILESNRYVFSSYLNGIGPKAENKIRVLFDKITYDTHITDFGEFINDIDGGLNIWPVFIFQDSLMIDFQETYKIKAHVASEAFKNSTPRFPEKKQELEKLANSLDENDNPVLMLVKLKE